MEWIVGIGRICLSKWSPSGRSNAQPKPNEMSERIAAERMALKTIGGIVSKPHVLLFLDR